MKPLAILFEMKIGLTNIRDGGIDGFFIYLKEFNLKKYYQLLLKKRLVIEYF